MIEELKRAKGIVDSEPDEAMRICCEVMNKELDSDVGQMALFMAGYIMMNAGRTGIAYHMFMRCAQLKPDEPEIYSNMGMCLEEDKPEEAVKLLKKAMKLKPGNVAAMANLALMNLQMGRPDECINLCNRVLKTNPDSRAAHHNKGLAKLMKRDFTGWDEYFKTLGVKHREARDYGLPDWNGEEGTVLVYGEQGVGDEIMFASCFEDLQKTNKVIFDCDKRLESIFKRNFDFEIHGKRFSDKPIEVSETPDYQCAIGQLPYFFRRNESDFPGKPYLKPDPERAVQWESILKDGPRIGIAWNGGTKGTRQQFRSTDLEQFKPIIDMDAQIVNLEYKPVDDEQMKEYGITNWPRAVLKGCDLEDTLALISRLDCVVTVCTTVVYLAGALGIPCYVIVPDYCGYRYHSFGSSFPWYNSVKLYRGGFNKSIREIKTDVENIHRIRPTRDRSLPCTLSLNTKTG